MTLGNTNVDIDLVKKALSHADPNVLRVALYQQTRDPELKSLQLALAAVPGTPFEVWQITDEDRNVLLDKACDYLASDHEVRPPPDREEIRELIELFHGCTLSDSMTEFACEELVFDGFNRAAKWPSEEARRQMPKDFNVLIVGAGFSAIVCAIQLDLLGIPNRIVERQSGFGGTWLLNQYPDARVDITSFIYSFTFEPDYPWKHAFAPREELMEYVHHLVDKYGLAKRASFNTKVVEARWIESKAKWSVVLRHADGASEQVETNVLLSASGLFSTPKRPDIEGIDRYRGKMFHTTEWDHTFDYAGKRVALIGTGSTGSQLLPSVAGKVQHISVFQRTPNWVTPVGRYRSPIREERKWLLKNMPGYAQWNRYSHVEASIRLQPFQYLDADWQARGGKVNSKNDGLREALTDMIRTKMSARPELVEHLIPDFAPLSRRIVVDNGWYDALLRDNVELVTETISHFTERGIVTIDGVEREFDMVILAAGFQVERYLYPAEYIGRNGKTLQDLWSCDGARAYLTMTIPDFPNFFMMYGPNAGVRAGSFHSSVEMLSRYICETITGMIQRGAKSAAIREEIYAKYNARIDEGMKRMLWEQEKGGRSYYLNSHGRSGVNMPFELTEFYDFVRRPKMGEFDLR